MYPFTSESCENLDSFLNSHLETWKSDSVIQGVRPSPLSVSTLGSEAHPNAFSRVDSDIRGQPTSDKLEPVSSIHETSLDERFECVMKCVRATGFKNFDALVIAYYNDHFGESSQLSSEQRLSRNRRLPGVIADMFGAARQWSAWERRGFYDEILKATEAMLISENSDACDTMHSGIASFLEGQGSGNSTPLTQDISSWRTEVPNKVSLEKTVVAGFNHSHTVDANKK